MRLPEQQRKQCKWEQQAGPQETQRKKQRGTVTTISLAAAAPTTEITPGHWHLCIRKCFLGALWKFSTPLNSYSKAEYGMKTEDLVGILLLNAAWKPDTGYLSIVYHNMAGVSDIPKNLSSACRRPKGAQKHQPWSKHPSQSIPETANLNCIFFWTLIVPGKEIHTNNSLRSWKFALEEKPQTETHSVKLCLKKDKTLTLRRGWQVGM